MAMAQPRAGAIAVEPALKCEAAVWSPSTGIVDSHALMLSLQGDLEHAGGMVVLNTAVAQAHKSHDAILVISEGGARLRPVRWSTRRGCLRLHAALEEWTPARTRCPLRQG
jgi:L-2-hydroxyglutarate oxidase LhgO